MSKIVAIFRVPGMTPEQYDNIHKDLDAIGQRRQEKRPIHIMALWNNGSTVIDVWDSQEDLNKFFETLGPILVKNGVNPPEPEILPVHDILLV
jgi:hypothetical protein